MLRKSVNSPLEKAGKNPCFRQRVYWIHARPSFFSGRADNACTNLLGFFVRYVRTRGSMRLRRAAKSPIFTLSFAARTCHARLARLTRARGRRFLRGRKALLNDFWYFWSRKSTRKEKLLYDSLRRQQATALRTKPKHNQQTKQKICFPSRQRRYWSHARHPLSSGRAGDACTNLLGYLV